MDKLFPRATELAVQDIAAALFHMKTMSWTYWQLTILFPVNFQSLHLSFSPSPSFSSLTPSPLWLVFLPPLVLSPARPKETTTSTCYQRVKKTKNKHIEKETLRNISFDLLGYKLSNKTGVCKKTSKFKHICDLKTHTYLNLFHPTCFCFSSLSRCRNISLFMQKNMWYLDKEYYD